MHIVTIAFAETTDGNNADMDNRFIADHLSQQIQQHASPNLSAQTSEIDGAICLKLMFVSWLFGISFLGISSPIIGERTLGFLVLVAAIWWLIQHSKTLLRKEQPRRYALIAFNAVGMLTAIAVYLNYFRPWMMAEMSVFNSASTWSIHTVLTGASISGLFYAVTGLFALPVGIACDKLASNRRRVKILGCGKDHDQMTKKESESCDSPS